MPLSHRYSTTANPWAPLLLLGLAIGLAPRLALADSEPSAPASSSIAVHLSLTPAPPRYPGDAVTMIASADPAVPGVAYQFLWDDSIIQPWSAAMSCPWVLPEAIGPHRVTIQFRLPDGAIQETTQTSGAAAGFTWGLLRGIGRGFIRTAAGAYEFFTFPFPAPPGYEPVIQPEYVFTEPPAETVE